MIVVFTREVLMGFNVFSDDWDRLRSGDLYLSDCAGLDRGLDGQLIKYIAVHWNERNRGREVTERS